MMRVANFGALPREGIQIVDDGLIETYLVECDDFPAEGTAKVTSEGAQATFAHGMEVRADDERFVGGEGVVGVADGAEGEGGDGGLVLR
jgi:hypothetical protein